MAMVVKLEKQKAPTPNFEILTVTPALASSWLEESKFDNRRLDSYNVDKIARDIKDKKWIFDGNPIRFDTEGNILDGQHRLWAIITAEKAVECAVVHELDSLAKNVIDSGKSRTIGDIFHFNGHKNNSMLASCARLYIGYRTNGKDMRKWAQGNAHKRLSASELLKEIKNSPGLPEAVSRAVSHAHAKKLLGTGVSAFSNYILSKVDPIAADEFFYLLNSGANLKECDPILILRQWCVVKDFRGVSNGNSTTAIKIAVVIKAWNAWRKNKQIQRLSYNYENEAYPVAE